MPTKETIHSYIKSFIPFLLALIIWDITINYFTNIDGIKQTIIEIALALLTTQLFEVAMSKIKK